jgi:hypothetical protein
MHLTETTYVALLRDGLTPPEAKALAAHLDEPCEACEAFLASRSEADGLDGAVDRALTALAERGDGQGNDLEFARVMKRVDASPRRATRGRRLAFGVAIAATVAIAGAAGLVAPRLLRRPAADAEKGTGGDAVPLRLRFLVLTPGDGGVPVLEKGISGQQVPAAASLQFQVELGRTAWVTLLRTSPSGSSEVFFERQLGVGRNVISMAGQPAAYPLTSLAGQQRFMALASETRVAASDLARAATLGAGARLEEGPSISVDIVEVSVRP